MSQKVKIDAVDGYALGGRLFEAKDAREVVLLNGATGVPQRYYARFAEWAASGGRAVVTYDYRGLGESKPHRLRGFPGSMSDWGRLDFEGVLRFARQRFPGARLTVIGHSVGGQLLGLAPSAPSISRVVTVAAQFGAFQLWPAPHRWALAGLWFGLMPAVTVAMGRFPGKLGIGADLPRNVALEWARWCRSRDFFLAHGVDRGGFERLKMPVRSFSFSDDLYAPRAAVDALHALMRNAEVERRHLVPAQVGASRISHFGFFQDAGRERLWPEVFA